MQLYLIESVSNKSENRREIEMSKLGVGNGTIEIKGDREDAILIGQVIFGSLVFLFIGCIFVYAVVM